MMSDRSFAKRIRQNHAIEHATLTILAQKQPGLRLVARSDLQGFIVYGDVALADLWATAEEAVRRLRAGESSLAVHANCGTNLVAAGTLSAVAVLLASAGRRRTLWERVPSAILGATGALLLAEPAGRWLQAHITTSADVDGAAVTAVETLGKTPVARHRVAIA
jgi:hypothetical protein